MATDEDELADTFLYKAYKKLSGRRIFGSKYQDAAKLFDKAADAFKLSKSWDRAGSAYANLARCHLKLKSNYEAAGAYADAAHSYRKVNAEESISCLEQSLDIFLDIGRLNMAAKYYKELAELYESERNFQKAIDCYEKAADLFQSDEVFSTANQCRKKIAKLAALLKQYQKAIEIFEDRAKQSLINNLLGYGAKEHFLRAGICHLCLGKEDDVAINNVLNKYQELDPTFSRSGEFRLLMDLAEAIDQEDVGKFTDVVRDFDSVTRLDAWKTTMLLRVKEALKGKQEENHLT